ncbi:MAG: FemAB family PEP-CTERM system-associated protein [Phycisphaeraceae bacterium]|nr:FemAB family PEP-CTERM system-associated protein [Phycisphaeraceae bacterium]
MRFETVKYPDIRLSHAVERLLATAGPEHGLCGEHDPRWLEVLSEALRHEPWCVLAWDESAGGEPSLAGYLPLMLVRSALFGRFLVSLPYLNRGSSIAMTQEAAQGLISEAAALAGRLKVRYLELRRHQDRIEHPALGAARDDKHLMILDLPDSEEALWEGLSAKVRNQIRKGERSGLQVDWGAGRTGLKLLEEFYRVFAINMRDLGTPVYTSRLFARILERFGDQAELCVVRLDGRAVAGAMLIHDRLGNMVPSTQVPSASSLREFNASNANMWMYHRLLIRAIERGSRQFDFGRSSEGSGTYRFKKQWGAHPQPTVWQYHILKGEIGSMRPDHPSNQRRIRIWRKLPLWLTLLAGPPIVRGIP